MVLPILCSPTPLFSDSFPCRPPPPPIHPITQQQQQTPHPQNQFPGRTVHSTFFEVSIVIFLVLSFCEMQKNLCALFSCGKGKENGGPYKLNCDIYKSWIYLTSQNERLDEILWVSIKVRPIVFRSPPWLVTRMQCSASCLTAPESSWCLGAATTLCASGPNWAVLPLFHWQVC